MRPARPYPARSNEMPAPVLPTAVPSLRRPRSGAGRRRLGQRLRRQVGSRRHGGREPRSGERGREEVRSYRVPASVPVRAAASSVSQAIARSWESMRRPSRRIVTSSRVGGGAGGGLPPAPRRSSRAAQPCSRGTRRRRRTIANWYTPTWFLCHTKAWAEHFGGTAQRDATASARHTRCS